MSQLGRSSGLTGFVELAREAGLDPYRLATVAGVPAAALTNPEMPISASAIANLIELAATRAGRSDFGLRMSETRGLANLGALGLALRHQPNLRAVLQILVDYSWLQNDSFTTTLEDLGDVTVLRSGSVASLTPQSMEMAMGVMIRIAATLRGPAWRPLEVRFVHRAPADLTTQRRIFGVTPLYEQDFLGMVFDRRDLEVPIAGADAALAAEAVRYLKQVAAGRGTTLRDRVREFIMLQLPNGACSADRVAFQLGFDRRTLHRRLAAEATSYSEVLATVRADLAGVMLSNSERSLQSIADMLGFASLSAFAHWFRRTFGCTASAYRADHTRPGRGPLALA